MTDQSRAKKKNTQGMEVREKQPVSSKVKEMTVSDYNSFEEELCSDKPISFMNAPLDEVKHNDIPANLRESIITTYGEDFFMNKTWTRVQLARLNQAISRPRENISSSIAQVCSAECAMKDICPYDIAGKPPLGDRCILEIKHAELSYKEYVIAISDRLGIFPEDIKTDIVLHNFINGLVEADMIEARLNHTIANDGFITDSPSAVNQNTGEVYYKEEEAVAVRIKDRIARRKDQIYRQLLATPEMAEKYKRGKEADNITRQNEILNKLEAMVNKATEPKEIEDLSTEDING